MAARHKSDILFAVAILFGLALIFRLREILLLIYVSALFAVVTTPFVTTRAEAFWTAPRWQGHRPGAAAGHGSPVAALFAMVRIAADFPRYSPACQRPSG